MPANWKDIDIKAIAKDSAKKTDDKLAGQISSLTRLTEEEVKKLFPDKGDIALFAELNDHRQIIRRQEQENQTDYRKCRKVWRDRVFAAEQIRLTCSGIPIHTITRYEKHNPLL